MSLAEAEKFQANCYRAQVSDSIFTLSTLRRGAFPADAESALPAVVAEAASSVPVTSTLWPTCEFRLRRVRFEPVHAAFFGVSLRLGRAGWPRIGGRAFGCLNQHERQAVNGRAGRPGRGHLIGALNATGHCDCAGHGAIGLLAGRGLRVKRDRARFASRCR
jgi:hypothetical protein